MSERAFSSSATGIAPGSPAGFNGGSSSSVGSAFFAAALTAGALTADFAGALLPAAWGAAPFETGLGAGFGFGAAIFFGAGLLPPLSW